MKSFRDLTYEDLYDCAGKKTVSRGRSYQRGSQVLKVYQISDKSICGSVRGNKIYDTVVSARDHLTSNCSCPVGRDCKHGVALILAYLEQIKQGKKVSEPPPEEYIRLFQPLLSYEPKKSDTLTFSVEPRTSTPEQYLYSLSKDELIKIILSCLHSTLDIASYLDRRQKINQTSQESSISAIVAEINEVTSQEVEYSDWYEMDEDNMPDYSGILESFTGMFDSGRYGEIIELGLILLQKGGEQVEMDDESGTISSQIEECIGVVAKALKKSDLPIHQRILSAIELIQTDEYTLTDEIRDFINIEHPGQEWSLVADILLEQRNRTTIVKEAQSIHKLKSLEDWIEIALERSGRVDEAIQFLKQLAEEENRYLPLIKLLSRTNHKKDAIEWIQRGVKKTCQDPYAAAQFVREMKKICEESADWLMITALDTEAFLINPDIRGYKQMMISAERAEIADSIRPKIQIYLKGGTLPSSATEGNVFPGLLPETGMTYGRQYAHVDPPVRPLLLEIALLNKDSDEVMEWYIPNAHRLIIGPGQDPDDRVADVIAIKYPEKAIDIWKTLAEKIIEMKNPERYHDAVMILIKVRDVSTKIGKSVEFSEYILHLKTEQLRKRRFIQELAILEGRTIIDDM